MAGNDAGYIYAIAAEGTPYIKIGLTTTTVEQRLRYLQTAHPFQLTIIAALHIENLLPEIEQQIHTALASVRRTGEWFELPLDAAQFLRLVEEASQHVRSQPVPTRPKLGKEPYVHLGLRFDPQMLPALDAYVADVQRQIGPWEVRIDRGKALRYLVVSGLRTLGYLPGDAGGGPVEATVTLGADQRADPAPMGADQSLPKTAPSQDHERTTGRTGRKRTTAAAKG